MYCYTSFFQEFKNMDINCLSFPPRAKNSKIISVRETDTNNKCYLIINLINVLLELFNE